MSRASVLAQARRAAEAGMVDACVIEKPVGQTKDPDTQVVTTTYETVYTGPCRMQQRPAQAQEETVGEQAVLMLTRELQLPVPTSTGVGAGHRAYLTTSTNDPALLGRFWTVKGEHGKTEASARRLVVEEVT